MKFKCGECGKLYMIVDENIPQNGLNIECKVCANEFSVNRNRSFFSTSRTSQIICDNCGKYVAESKNQCPHCNLIINKAHEELRIDNRYYESLGREQDIPNQQDTVVPEVKKKGRVVMLAGFAFVFIIGCFIALSTYTDVLSPAISGPVKRIVKPDATKIEKQVVILKSGETYYVDKIEKEGDRYHLTHLNGVKNSVSKADVLTITTAVIDKKFIPKTN